MMIKKLQLLTLLVLSFTLINAQESPRNMKVDPVAEYIEFLKQEDIKRKEKIEFFLKSHSEYIIPKNTYIHHIDKNGNPVLYRPYSNKVLASSLSTSKLHPSGGLGLSLTGDGMEVSANRARLGVWEPNPVRTTHREFTNRAVTRDNPKL